MKKTTITYFIASCILLFVLIAAYGFWYSLIVSESTQVTDLAGKIADENQTASRAASASSELATLTTQESTIDQYFVATSDVVPFLEQIQSIGTYLGATVQVVSVSADPGTPFGHLTLSLQIKGSFDAVARTVGAVEYEPYDTIIKTVSFDQDPSAGVSGSSTPHTWTASAVYVIGAQTGTSTPATAT